MSHFALETVITFLRRYGRPRQMTFDRDPTLSLGECQAGIFPLRCVGSWSVWGLRLIAARRIDPIKIHTWRGITAPTDRSAYTSIGRAR
jgi:hypothetical protein